MPKQAYASFEDEFWYNVSPQDDLPIAGEVDLNIDLDFIYSFFSELSNTQSVRQAKRLIAAKLIKDPSLFDSIRQFLGISDKRAYLDLSYISSRKPHPTEPCSLCGCYPWTLARHPMSYFRRLLSGSQGDAVKAATADMISDYLINQGLYESGDGFSKISKPSLELIYTRLIAPKEYQQKAAKRRGHGCEAALAYVLEQCGADIIPENRASNPMGANDPHMNLEKMMITERQPGVTHAFDILIKNGQRIAVVIQALIHTSDPGQYGVDKSNETVQISEKIDEWNKHNPKSAHIELWGLVDGVGFSENKTDTINKLLRHFSTFIQLKTLYKAPLRLHHLGMIQVKAIKFSEYYDKEDIEFIKELYVPDDVEIISSSNKVDSSWKPVVAGEATVYVLN